MKRIYILLLLVGTLVVPFGCQDELEEDFIDPSVYSPTDNIPSGMFAAMMSRTRTFKNDYAEFWWHADAGGIIGHTHLIGRFMRDAYSWFSDLNDVNIFYTTMTLDSYFYGHNTDFKEIPLMEKEIEAMSEEDRVNNEIYLSLSKMVRGYRASKAVDLYNSVPYSEALKGVEGEFFPKFDDPMEIYKSIINDLKAYSELAVQQEAKMSPEAKAVFQKQDIIFEGDITKWKQWANAVRLRLAVRISGVAEEFAKQAIGEVISGNNLPTDDLLIPGNLWISESGNHWKLGLRERDYAGFIPPTIMYKMDRDMDHKYSEGIDDPRLPVYFLPNRDTLYMPISFDFGIGQKIYNHVRADNNEKYNFGGAYYYYNYFADLDNYMKYNGYSVWNPATMVRNVEPVRAFTRAEVDFLLAEIELKGLGNTSKTVAENVKSGVKNSIDYWYHINSFTTWDKIDDSNRNFLKPDAPDPVSVEQFATSIVEDYNNTASFEDKMEIIIGQKYVHLNIHDYFEVLSELRRTRHPKLPLIKFSDALTLKPELERIPYPGAESDTNLDAMTDVIEEDNYTSHIFWVPEDLRNVSYYESSIQDKYRFTKYEGVPESFPNE